jgi:hypothetical protein
MFNFLRTVKFNSLFKIAQQSIRQHLVPLTSLMSFSRDIEALLIQECRRGGNK